MEAAYVFGVRFTLSPRRARIDPESFETTLRIPAATPGEEGWLLFRDALWRGEANDADHVRRLCGDRLPEGVEVLSAEFRELETDEAYLAALRAAVGDDLAAVRSDSAREALHKYLGSSIRVVDADATDAADGDGDREVDATDAAGGDATDDRAE
ncbi:LWR-salt protein [Halobaculum sp. CBA1158]|uniref:LWR-salt protein n=1 Tax=Halobaculum sp. CBA1158 TaxID=2904243 RepID=UPI002AA2A982|nr:LWR-salt protein [Halobaculum sp. CBA1158]